ncbi:MAG: T9SS type A sorting domain-containing protein [Bacteroidetes bacterium]|nr:T9SS type A sorting domain-containing protein [Bacteroidota bacterium]
MKQRIVILLFILLSSISTSIVAQGFKSELLGNIGASHCILVDGDTAWLGMQNGILRINLINHNVKWYSTNELDFRSNIFVNIKKDKKGNIWFINNQGQVFEYNHQTFISRDNGTKFLNIQDQRNSFLEVDQIGNIYHFRHNENHDFVPDTFKIVVRDSTSLSIYNSPDLLKKSCFAADSLGVYILADSLNGRTIKHFQNGVFNRSFPVYRASVVPGSGSYFQHDYSNIFLLDTMIYYYNFFSHVGSIVYYSNVLLRYTISGTFIDSVNFSPVAEKKCPVLNPKTNEVYLLSRRPSDPHLKIDSTGSIQTLTTFSNIPIGISTAHFDEVGNLFVLYPNSIYNSSFNSFLSKIDTNGVQTFYQLPYPLNKASFYQQIYPMYDSSILTYNSYTQKAILYDGVSVSDFATVTNNFVIDSGNTMFFIRNDSIIKYKNGLILLKTKLPFTYSYNVELVYEGGDSLYFYYGSKIYAHHVNNGGISIIGSLGAGYITMNKSGELFFRESVNKYYWMRDGNYNWYKLNFSNTGVPNSILTDVYAYKHFNDGSSWFSNYEKIVKRDANGIWTIFNFHFAGQTPITPNLCGGFYDNLHQSHWLIYPSLMLKIDSTGITKFNWKNSDVSFSYDQGSFCITNDGKYWMMGLDGSFIRISFDSIMANSSYEKYNITGNIYHDLNANGAIDSVDNALPFIRVRNDKGVHTYSNFEGYYQFLERPGQRVIQPAPYPYLVLSCDSTSYTVNIDSTAIDSLDFALKSIADTLLSVSSFATSRARCNFQSSATYIVQNNGNSFINVLAAFTPDAACSVLSFSQAPDSTSGTTFFWKIDSLTLLSSKNIGVTYTVPSASFNSISSIFDTYIYDSTTSTLFTTDTIYQNIACSFDPNEKQVSPVGRETAHYTLFSDTLVYTLLFQNTGNDTAYTVTLIDTISPLLDIESFTLLSMSHNGIVTIDSNGVLKVVFDDINLLWESANFDESQGYLQFSILPLPGLPEFTVVKNKVLIIFDRNPYILTNEVFNTLVTTFPTTALNQLQESKHKISVYPNPANTYFNLSFDQPLNTAYVVTLIDISGKIIQSWTTTEQNPTFSIDALKAGFYLIQISNNVDFKAVAKFVKQ